MPSFVDVVALKEAIEIRGVEIEVQGLGIDAIGEMMVPEELQRAIVGAKFSLIALLQVAPVSIRRLLCAAIGKKGDAREEEAVANLNAEDQIALIEALIRVSFPGGVSPFVDRVGAILGIDGLMDRLERLGRDAASSRALGTSASQPSTSS